MNRIAWLDNLRICVIIMVVILHTAVTYSGLGGWYYKENDQVGIFSTLFFAFYLTFTQAWFMSMLFMVSGYFTQLSLIRKGPRKFIGGRLSRLGLPLLIFMFIIHPLSVKLAYPDLDMMGWYLNGLLHFDFLGWTGPLWFVEAILIFTFVYLVLYRLFIGREFRTRIKIRPVNTVLLILLITFTAFVLRLVYPIGTNFYNLQFGFFAAYMAFYSLGILAAASGLFNNLSLSDGKRWLAISLGIGIPAWLAVMFFGGPLEGNMEMEGGMNWPAFFYALWESFFCVSFIIAMAGLFKYRVNKTGRIQQFLSDNAFGVFVFHTPVLISISIMLKDIYIHPLVKFGIVSVLALSGSFLVSYLLRRIGIFRRIFS